MKLESLNNSKYSLTPEKMGELVGGQVTRTCTGGGGTYHGKAISADYRIDYSGQDVQDGIYGYYYPFTGDNDVAKRDARFNQCNCK